MTLRHLYYGKASSGLKLSTNRAYNSTDENRWSHEDGAKTSHASIFGRAFNTRKLPVILHPAAFSLIELLVVLAVVALLVAVSLPAISAISGSYYLGGSANTFLSALDYARQEASTLNVPVEVRFYQYAISGFPNETAQGSFHAYQFFEELPAGSQPVTKVEFLPGRIVFSANSTLSPLLLSPPSAKNSTPPAIPNIPTSYSYTFFVIRPNGTTNLTSANNYYVTLCDAATQSTPPANYATLVIDPISSTARVLRP